MKNIFRPSLSSILISFLFIVIVAMGLFSEVFISEVPEINLAQIYANPIQHQELKYLKKIELTNKNGDFIFENTHPKGDIVGPWQMLAPQSLKAKDEIIRKIVDALKGIRVRNFHSNEPINVSSFSLDNPTLNLKIHTKNKKLEMKMGLINPIDNSAYMSLSHQDQIFQIDPLEISLESYDLSQLVESKVLALNFDSLASMELYEKNNLLIKFLKKENNWMDQNGVVLATNKVKEFIDRLESIRSQSILDNLSNEQKEFLNKIVSTSVYTLKIISTVGVRNYFFGHLKEATDLPDLPKEIRGSFVMSSEDKDSFVIINNEELNFLNTQLKNFK